MFVGTARVERERKQFVSLVRLRGLDNLSRHVAQTHTHTHTTGLDNSHLRSEQMINKIKSVGLLRNWVEPTWRQIQPS